MYVVVVSFFFWLEACVVVFGGGGGGDRETLSLTWPLSFPSCLFLTRPPLLSALPPSLPPYSILT